MINETDLVYRLRKRAEIRRRNTSRKSVLEGKPDRISDLLEEAAAEIEKLRLKDDTKDNIVDAQSKTWIVTPEFDSNGDVILPLPTEFCEQNDWVEGDNLDFEITPAGLVVTNLSEQSRKKSEA